MILSQDLIFDFILGSSAFVIAVSNIYQFIKKPKKMIEDYQNKEREEILAMIKEAIREESKKSHVSCEQHTVVLKLVLSTQIERIYWTGLAAETLYLYNLETLNLLYESYRALGGNGYIEHLMNLMRTWKVVDIHDPSFKS
jgi:hypothetical protein